MNSQINIVANNENPEQYITLKDLKVGDFFRMKSGRDWSPTVYVRLHQSKSDDFIYALCLDRKPFVATFYSGVTEYTIELYTQVNLECTKPTRVVPPPPSK